MARTTVPPKSDRNLADVPISIPPLGGPERALWFGQLDNVISVDILAQRLQLRDIGLPPAAIEGAMADYRDWLTARLGGVCDWFALEIAWAAA